MLNAELNHIGGAIRQHDEITKSIKNWAVVTWTASIGLSLKETGLHPFIWMTAIVPLVFWIVDGCCSDQCHCSTWVGGVPIRVEKRNGAFFRKDEHPTPAVLADGRRRNTPWASIPAGNGLRVSRGAAPWER
jgi:hypothetical protein